MSRFPDATYNEHNKQSKQQRYHSNRYHERQRRHGAAVGNHAVTKDMFNGYGDVVAKETVVSQLRQSFAVTTRNED